MYLFTCQALSSNFVAASAWDMCGRVRPSKFGTRYLKLLASISGILTPIMQDVKLLMPCKSQTFGNMKTQLI